MARAFDTDGKVLPHFDSGNDYAYGVVIEPDGKIVAAGRAYNGTNDDFALACYNPNGTLFTDFGTSGKVLSDFGGGWDGAQAIALLPREDVTGGLDSLDLIVAGQVWTDQYDFAAVRCFSPAGGLPVEIQNVAPTLTVADPQTVLVGQPFTITDLGTFTDPGFDKTVAPPTSETFTYEIDWGDESEPDTGAATIDTMGSAGQPTEGSFDGTHTYSETGEYTVTITLSDDDGGIDTQYLDITSAPDVAATGFSANGTSLLVDYYVAGAALPSLTIGIYLSSDGTTPESLLQTLSITNSTDLGVGAHEVSITPDFPDIQDDYFLIAVVDADGTITEPDEDNNDLLFEGGVFRTVGGTIYIHGAAGADPVDVSGTGTLHVTFDSETYSYSYNPWEVPLVQILGHEGNDTLTTASAVECPMVVFGGPGDDALTTGAGADFIDGGVGVDSIFGSAGDDFIEGGDGNDIIYAGAGNDVIHAGLGDDYADGGDGNDMIYGDEGNDSLAGGDGNNWIQGGDGNDTLYGGSYADVLYGDDGDDGIYGQASDDVLVGGDGNDMLYGGDGWDDLYGWPGNDTLHGGNGGDILRGGDGNDLLYGDAGDDDLDGEGGFDTLDGGTGVNDPQYVDEQAFQYVIPPYWTISTGAGYNGDYAVNTDDWDTGYVQWWYPYAPWGYQQVFVTWVPGGSLDADVPYRVHHGGGSSDAIEVNQQSSPPDDYPEDPLLWKSLGVWDGVRYVDANYLKDPPRWICADAVLFRGVDPIYDIATDSNNDGSITAEDDPAEDLGAWPGRIVAVGSSELTEVKLDARAVDAILSEPQQWDAYLLTTDGDKISVYYDPDGQDPVDVFNEGGDYREHVFHWNITQQGPLDMSVWVEGLAGDLARLQLILVSRPGVDPYKRDYGWTDTVKFTLVDVHVNLEAKTILHNQPNGVLSESQEDDPGAWVPLNNDADAYDRYDGQTKDDRNAGWFNLPGPIPGEDDLLPIVLKAVDTPLPGESYRLHIPANVRVWQQPNRTGPVTNSTKLPATGADRTLYVEGIAPGTGVISVDLYFGFFPVVSGADSVSVNVFDWTGPLNVPGYTRYLYRASGGMPGWSNSMWWPPESQFGSIWSSTQGDAIDEATILWNGGPFVGKAVYQAAPNYVWDLGVNVVQIALGTPNDGAAHGSPVQVGGAGSATIAASGEDFAMIGHITVQKVEGPTVNGAQRGRKFMELGLSHQARIDAKHALYNDSTPPKRVRSSLEDGLVHWDIGSESIIPWPHLRSDMHLDITSDSQPVVNHVFLSVDNPQLLTTDRFVLNGDQADVLAAGATHWVPFIVRTKDPRVIGDDPPWTERALLVWYYDGTGTVNGAGVWQLTGLGVHTDNHFTELFSGMRLPAAETNLAAALANATWITENQ